MIYLTSDEHYGHHNIIEYCKRPFSDVHEMTLGLIAKHNRRVDKEDVVIHLGDFCWKPAEVPEILRQLSGRHQLVVGNHDSCHPMRKHWERETRMYKEAGFEVINWGSVLDGMLLNHMPYKPDARHEGRKKFEAWSPKDEGRILLHGHVHDAWKFRDREINVGVDVWDYQPVTVEEILRGYHDAHA